MDMFPKYAQEIHSYNLCWHTEGRGLVVYRQKVIKLHIRIHIDVRFDKEQMDVHPPDTNNTAVD